MGLKRRVQSSNIGISQEEKQCFFDFPLSELKLQHFYIKILILRKKLGILASPGVCRCAWELKQAKRPSKKILDSRTRLVSALTRGYRDELKTHSRHVLGAHFGPKTF